MDKPIVVLAADEEQRRELCVALEREHYRTTPLHSLENLDSSIHEDSCQVVLVDLDNLPVDNRLFRELKRRNPAVCIMALSSRPFHPELQEAMSTHIYASLAKPVDTDELVYWIRSICENDMDSRDSPVM